MAVRSLAFALPLHGLVDVVESASAHAERPTAYGARLEAGAEYDSNPTRREDVEGTTALGPLVPSLALRLALSADADQRTTDRLSLSLGGGLAARKLADPGAIGEDLLIGDGHAGAAFTLSDHFSLGAAAAYYDVAQRADTIEDARDFRSVAPSARVMARFGRSRVQLGGGWRWFTFKPARELDFAGPTASLGYAFDPTFSLDGGADWEASVGGSLEERRFPSVACAANQAGCPSAGVSTRLDRFYAFDGEVTRTSETLVGLGLGVQHNDSDLVGQSLWRLLVRLRLVLLLPWDFSFTARGELVLTSYSDAVLVGQGPTPGNFVTIEDEGRSSLRLDLSRPLVSHLEAGLRATIYQQTPANGPVRFSRQIYLVYLAVTFGR